MAAGAEEDAFGQRANFGLADLAHVLALDLEERDIGVRVVMAGSRPLRITATA